MAYPQRLKLTSGPYTWTSTLPQRPFVPARQGVGGGDESWAGVPEVWVDRQDRTLALRPRFTEAEWPELADVIDYARYNAAVLTVWPDAAEAGDSYATYLLTPRVDEEFKPEPTDVGGYGEVSLRVRTVDGSAINPLYYDVG